MGETHEKEIPAFVKLPDWMPKVGSVIQIHLLLEVDPDFIYVEEVTVTGRGRDFFMTTEIYEYESTGTIEPGDGKWSFSELPGSDEKVLRDVVDTFIILAIYDVVTGRLLAPPSD